MSRKSNCIQIQVEEGEADARNFPDKIELRATRTLLQTPLPKIENHYFNEHVILLICNYVIYICTSISSNCFFDSEIERIERRLSSYLGKLGHHRVSIPPSYNS